MEPDEAVALLATCSPSPTNACWTDARTICCAIPEAAEFCKWTAVSVLLMLATPIAGPSLEGR